MMRAAEAGRGTPPRMVAERFADRMASLAKHAAVRQTATKDQTHVCEASVGQF